MVESRVPGRAGWAGHRWAGIRRASHRWVGTVAVALTLGGCSVWGMEGGPGGAGGAVGAGQSSSEPASVTAVEGPDGVQRAEVQVGDDLRMHPELVRARAGTIEVTLRNTGTTPHDVSVPVPGLPVVDSGNLNGGQTTVVRIRVDQPGRYRFPCLYHQSSGMTGTLLVA